MLRTREGDVERGIPINPKMGRITFEDAAADLLNDYKVNGKETHAHAKRRIDLHLKPLFKGKRLLSIRPRRSGRTSRADRQSAPRTPRSTANSPR